MERDLMAKMMMELVPHIITRNTFYIRYCLLLLRFTTTAVDVVGCYESEIFTQNFSGHVLFLSFPVMLQTKLFSYSYHQKILLKYHNAYN